MSGGIVVGSITVTGQRINTVADTTIATTTMTDVTGLTFTADDNVGSSLAVANMCWEMDTTNQIRMQWLDNATVVKDVSDTNEVVNVISLSGGIPVFVANDGQTVKIQMSRATAGSLIVRSGALQRTGIEVLEIT